jgi:hypothetical protein
MTRAFLFLCFSFFLISACTRYQYLDYATQENRVLDNGVYTFENDSIKFTYQFYGLYTNVALTIENKTSAPIFIDWKHSGLVYNGRSIKLKEDRIRMTTVVTQSPPELFDNNRTVITTDRVNHSTNANMLLPTGQYRSDAIVALRSRVIDLKENPPTSFQILPEQNRNGDRQVHVFEIAQSPMRFQFFFTIKYGIDQRVSQSYAHPFYLRYLEETKRKPSKSGREIESHIQIK